MRIMPSLRTANEIGNFNGDDVRSTEAIQPVSSGKESKQQYYAPSDDSSISLQVRDQPMLLVYRAIVTKLSENFRTELDNSSMQRSVQTEYSSTITAKLILSVMSNMYEIYKHKHVNQDSNQKLVAYIGIFKQSIEQGFSEAHAILSGMDVLSNEVKISIGEAYKLIQRGIVEFQKNTAATLLNS